MRDGKTSIHRPLEGAEHLVSGGGAGQASVQVAGEGTGLTIYALHVELIPGHLNLALVDLVQTEFVEQLGGKKQPRMSQKNI